MSKTNICVVGLSKQFTDDICKQLSCKLDMFYANVQEILEFELMNLGRVEEICGIEYLLKEEKSIIGRVCSYDNTLVNIDYSKLNNESILDKIKNNCLLIYLKLDEKRFDEIQKKENISLSEHIIGRDLFADRDFICNQFADITIDCMDLTFDEILILIIEQILKYYS